MKLGQLRQELENYKDLPDSTIIGAEVEDDSGEFIDQDVSPNLETWIYEGETYLYIKTLVQ